MYKVNKEIDSEIVRDGVPEELWNDFMNSYQSFLKKKKVHQEYDKFVEEPNKENFKL